MEALARGREIRVHLVMLSEVQLFRVERIDILRVSWVVGGVDLWNIVLGNVILLFAGSVVRLDIRGQIVWCLFEVLRVLL